MKLGKVSTHLETELADVKSDVRDIKIEITDLNQKFHRMLVIVKEQNQKSNYALEGYSLIYERQNDFYDQFMRELEEVRRFRQGEVE